MGKDKLRKFRENLTFRNMIQPEFEDIFHRDHPFKGRWREAFFHNENPIVLELGCGKGEYTVALGGRFPQRNFLGIDIKGARMWRGAKTAEEAGMTNVGFLRTRIEFIDSFFAPGEVDEIWITFPDPQLKKQRVKKRLTGPLFLERYARFLKPGGLIHLKTDSQHLHAYTKAVIEENELPIVAACDDIYGKGVANDILAVKTAYERLFLAKGMPITYLCFELGDRKEFLFPDFPADDAPQDDEVSDAACEAGGAV